MTDAPPKSVSQPSVKPLARWSLRIVVAIVVLVVAWRLLLMFQSAPGPVGLVDGRLRSCPSSPNCVCSQDEDAAHHIAPLRFNGSASDAWNCLRDVVGRLPRTRVVSRGERYLHVEFTTLLMRFVDDVEFLLDAEARTIHIRSASRVGYSDLGANRKRVEAIRREFVVSLPSAPSADHAG